MKAAKKAGRVAADGVIAIRAEAGKAVILEVNSETDFVARDENFLAFVGNVADTALSTNAASVEDLMNGDLENTREALIQKIGENITVRRIENIASENLSLIHISEPTRQAEISYAVFCLKKKNT